MTEGPTISIILARGGSKGVRGKNLREVGGLSLTARSVIASRSSEAVAATYVSTDDPAIALEAQRFGARIIDRPAELAGDDASSESGWLHALSIIRRDFPDVARLVLLQCTSPFTTGRDIYSCLRAMDAEQASCAVTVIRDHAFMWTRDEQGRGRGTNHDESKQRLRRQDLPPSFRESGAIYCVRTAEFEKVGRRFCGPVALHAINHPPIEIDTEADLELCNILASQPRRAGAAHDLSRIKAIVMDFDGVHTNDKVIVDERGVESVIVSRKDGIGVEILRKSGRFGLLILSKERNPVVQKRADKLGIDCLQACDDKVAALDQWLDAAGLTWDEIVFVGNDVNDLGPLGKAGLSACPCDAHSSVLPRVDWIIPTKGGEGVIRAVADLLLGDVAK